MKISILFLLFAAIYCVYSFTLIEIMIKGGVTTYQCFYKSNFVCDLGNDTFACFNSSSELQDCEQVVALLDCNSCISSNLTLCRVTNNTSGLTIYSNYTTKTELCANTQNCSELLPYKNTSTITTLNTCPIDCCTGHSIDYWKTHNSMTSYPNNITWPIPESTISCFSTYLSILQRNYSNAISDLQKEMIVASLNKASSPGACLNVTEIQYIEQAKTFIVDNCNRRLNQSLINMANDLRNNLQSINTKLIC